MSFFHTLIMGKVDYEDRARRFLNIVEDGVRSKGEPLQGAYHKYLVTKLIEWIEKDYPKEAEDWTKAVRERCDRWYPGLL